MTNKTYIVTYFKYENVYDPPYDRSDTAGYRSVVVPGYSIATTEDELLVILTNKEYSKFRIYEAQEVKAKVVTSVSVSTN